MQTESQTIFHCWRWMGNLVKIRNNTSCCNWILWLPTTKGFFSPKNIKDVHAYGIEFQADYSKLFSKNLKLDLDATYSWTPSINEGEPISTADQSVGKQLPYVPKHSATVTGRLQWNTWSFMYKWCFYSERFTMSSNEISLTGKLPVYFMNNTQIFHVIFSSAH